MNEGLELLTIFFLIIAGMALGATLLYGWALHQSAVTAPRLNRDTVAQSADEWSGVTVTVVIPAYNEANNIEACVRSVLQSTNWSCDRVQVWVVDDQSTDDTLQRVQALQVALADPRLNVLVGKPRPSTERWLGKNWACHQAAQQTTSDYLLFLDADVRLNPGALELAIAQVHRQHIDLLTGILTIQCGCWAEWLVQPLVAGFIAALLPCAVVNDPTSDAIFAVGPLMLFRRSAYEQVGGHAAVAAQVVEDVELARRIQQQGLKLHYTIATNLGTLRMYPTAAALWEGWTKNWHLSSRRNLVTTLLGAVLVFWLDVVPSLALLGFSLQGAMSGFSWLSGTGWAIALVTVLLQYPLRREIQAITAIPPRYWWLVGVGGVFFLAIILASIIKTETGWGWTWRGRPLQLPN